MRVARQLGVGCAPCEVQHDTHAPRGDRLGRGVCRQEHFGINFPNGRPDRHARRVTPSAHDGIGTAAVGRAALRWVSVPDGGWVGMASILVADDEPTLRRLLQATFGPDHRVAEAADGAEALRRLLADRPDLAILDIAMPGMDGLAVCRAARAEPSLVGLGIIVLSANATADAALVAGADRHLRKPFSPLALLAAIDEVLALRRPGPDGPPPPGTPGADGPGQR